VITKRTDELSPGDVVLTDHGQQRVIASVREATELSTTQHPEPIWDVEYVHPIAIPSPHGAWAAPDDQWRVVEPSKLDLAVQRAQELADKYQDPNPPFNKDFDELLALFRAAR